MLKPCTGYGSLSRKVVAHVLKFKGGDYVERSALPSNDPENRRGDQSWVSQDISLRSTMGRAHRETFFMTLEASTASSQAGSLAEGDQGESLRLVGWRIRGRNVQRWNDFLRTITSRSFNFACRYTLRVYNIGTTELLHRGSINQLSFRRSREGDVYTKRNRTMKVINFALLIGREPCNFVTLPL